jgi:DoxX-like family
MSIDRQRAALRLLQWTVGLVVLWQSFRFALFAVTAPNFDHVRMPPSVAFVLGATELLAAALFLIPKLERVGGYALLAVFALACAIHALHGEFEAGLLVYAAAVFACLATRSDFARNPA